MARKYLIVTEDGDAYVTDNPDLALKYAEQDLTLVYDVQAGTGIDEDGDEYPLDEAPHLADPDSDEPEGEDV